jgi:hypothetical protein
MADAIGIDRKYLQHGGTYREHFDIGKGKRAAAVARGAREVSQREVGRLIVFKLKGRAVR